MATIAAAVAVHLIIPRDSWALCESDADCSDGRKCVDGLCVLPEAVAEVAADGEAVESTNWGLGAGVAGLIAAAAVATTGIIAGANTDVDHVYLPFATASTAMLVITTPIVFVGGKSARVEETVNGISALRIIGWIVWGLSVATSAVTFLAYAIADGPPPAELLYSTSSGGAVGELMIAGDAMVSAGQVTSAKAVLSSDQPMFMPSISFAPSETPGHSVASINLAASF